MSTPAHSGWLDHGLAIVAAAAVSWGAVTYGGVFGSCGCAFPRKPDFDHPLRGYFDNYKQHPLLAAALERTFEDGSSIVLLGSSELTTADHPAKPVNFFNNELDVPLLALGHAGNQSFSMHAQLIAAGADMAHARLAILVSPSWFVDKSAIKGTELAAFLEYQPSPSLYRVQQRIEGGDPLTAPVSNYMAEHEHELGAAQPIVQWMTRDASPTGRYLYAFSQPWNRMIIEDTRSEMLQIPLVHEENFTGEDPGTSSRSTMPGPPAVREWRLPAHMQDSLEWSERYRMAVAEHLAQCTNNKVFVNDAYYAEHVQGRTRQVDVHPLEENRELRDFRGLLGYLKAVNAKPYFILQPLNPYVYTNLKEVDPTMNAIREELNGHGFRYLDMWVSDTAGFEPGTLTDVMHLGPLGWYRVDSAMANYFP